MFFRSKEVEEDTYLSNYKAEDAKAPCIYHVTTFRQFSDRYPCCDPLFFIKLVIEHDNDIGAQAVTRDMVTRQDKLNKNYAGIMFMKIVMN